MQVKEGGKTYNVVILGGPNINPRYKLVGNSACPPCSAGRQGVESTSK